jgi:aspartate carbamoyltransferase regulatory subunit
MLEVTSIEKGIVIDHIKAGHGIKLYRHLKLDTATFPVALISNCKSNKYGRKDIIKIQDLIELDFDKLGLIDPNISITIIENKITTKKMKLELPAFIEDVIICKNPRCITSNELQIPHKFKLIDREKRTYKCEYCEDIQIKLELK